ncbi:MAG: bluetail domain-containing putative surface protein, partial [Synechocystis sp.]
NDTYIVDNGGDIIVENPNEGTDIVNASVSYTLSDNVENLTLTGTDDIDGTGNAESNTIKGNVGNNLLNGGEGVDLLTGGGGNNTFVFQFGQSLVGAIDCITDFTFGTDKIDLLTQGGVVMDAPIAFSRVENSSSNDLLNAIDQVFGDADDNLGDVQILGVNSAALVVVNTSTYLIVNDGVAGFQAASDLVVNLTGFSGTLPDFGAIAVDQFFV